METSTFQAEKGKTGVRIYCPQGYTMQQKVEAVKGFDYCRERCGTNSDKYALAMNAMKCFWIAKEAR